MRPSSRRHVLGITASLVIAAPPPAVAQEQSHATKGPERSLISTVLTGAGDQAAAGHLLSCLAAAKACANTGIKHEGAAAAPAAVGGRARDRASQARGHQAEGRDILKNARRLPSSCGHRNVLRYVLSASRGAAVGFLVASTP